MVVVGAFRENCVLCEICEGQERADPNAVDAPCCPRKSWSVVRSAETEPLRQIEPQSASDAVMLGDASAQVFEEFKTNKTALV
jgi:hypothetical protein